MQICLSCRCTTQSICQIQSLVQQWSSRERRHIDWMNPLAAPNGMVRSSLPTSSPETSHPWSHITPLAVY
ncbi:hypothetical protein WOLCODRAFT_166359, partial [Wolfiporia cocos MD-104 SS10]